ncbi:DUF2829 domain-containing protein [Massilia violaceinigra]|uniref:DUF2829 domain-containing protein n=1 Tax=Massilia violaceinigra TaxID=2045208 RepID=A0ABY4A271_9BURK|nr:DUF2829 domain-containing protein [Massilia violaceinigra]UOD28768.1 DUF2829 domain-containing protein [Massilia violaceinigra]
MEALKAGRKVSRAGWNGKGLWVAMCEGSPALEAGKFWNPHARAYAEANGGACAVKPYMLLKTAQGDIQMGWAPSGPDAMADDWQTVDDSPVVRVAEPRNITLPPHQQRVIDERGDLVGKLDKLTLFLETVQFSTLDMAEQSRLHLQCKAMAAYAGVLAERIVAFTE